MLSLDTSKRIITALAGATSGNELITAVNNSGWGIPAAIVAAHVSTTTDFAALKAQDLVLHIPATAGNAAFFTVATAGTLPAAAIVGDLYVVLRSSANATQSAIKL